MDARFKQLVKEALSELLEEGVVEFEVDSTWSEDRVYRDLKVKVDGEVVSSTTLSIERKGR